MKKETLTHISSIVLLCIFLLLAFGSIDEKNNSESSYTSANDDINYEPDSQKKEQEIKTIYYEPDPQKIEQEINAYLEKQKAEDEASKKAAKLSNIENVQKDFENLRASLLQNLNKCYESAKNINQSDDQWDIESYKTEGNKYYNQAYQDFLKIQDPKYNLPSNKTSIISRALKYYTNGFNQIGKLGGPYEKEREDIQNELENWPYKETEPEKDVKEEIFKVEIESQSALAIQLPSKGTWCLWEITNNATIWIDGYVYNNGYGRFIVINDNLPKYLHTEKNFEIRNQSMTGTTVIFKMCELEN